MERKEVANPAIPPHVNFDDVSARLPYPLQGPSSPSHRDCLAIGDPTFRHPELLPIIRTSSTGVETCIGWYCITCPCHNYAVPFIHFVDSRQASNHAASSGHRNCVLGDRCTDCGKGQHAPEQQPSRRYCEECDHCYFHPPETHLQGKRHAKSMRSIDGTCSCKTNCVMGPSGHTPRRERTEMALLAAGNGCAKVAALVLIAIAVYYLHRKCRLKPAL
jgi:hypothetical protein